MTGGQSIVTFSSHPPRTEVQLVRFVLSFIGCRFIDAIPNGFGFRLTGSHSLIGGKFRRYVYELPPDVPYNSLLPWRTWYLAHVHSSVVPVPFAVRSFKFTPKNKSPEGMNHHYLPKTTHFTKRDRPCFALLVQFLFHSSI
jgi:hypothetical protein